MKTWIAIFIGFLFCLAPLALALAAPPTTVKGAYTKAEKLTGSHNLTEVVFTKDSFTLSGDGRSQLRELLYDAQKRGKIAEVKIISWADKEYPVGSQDLDKNQRRLADDRISEIRNYIEENTVDVKINSYNMAEQPDAVEKAIGTSSNIKVKNALEEAGLSHPRASGMPPKASHALVLVTLQ